MASQLQTEFACELGDNLVHKGNAEFAPPGRMILLHVIGRVAVEDAQGISRQYLVRQVSQNESTDVGGVIGDRGVQYGERELMPFPAKTTTESVAKPAAKEAAAPKKSRAKKNGDAAESPPAAEEPAKPEPEAEASGGEEVPIDEVDRDDSESQDGEEEG